ncbi:hypothetical protein KAI56_02055 [Candidatus Parcubacteria bacterium]|nr:hypothetical protein [Candidatus Parcubacteria bacterium]
MRYIIIKILNILSKKILVKYNPVVVGITGSVGKSSVKKAICEVLKDKYKIASNENYCKTDIGIPLAIIGAESGGRSVVKWIKIIFLAVKMIIKKVEYLEILILEMGVDRPDDMKKMLEIVKPNVGILTNIGKFPPHTKYFKNAKHIAKEKSLLIKSLKKKDIAILNCDDDIIKDLSENIRPEIISYGFNDGSIIKAGEIFSGDKKWKIESGLIGMSFKISYNGTTVPFRLPYALGRGQVYTALAASAVGIHFGYNLVEISEKLSNYSPLPGRMSLIKGINNALIIDDTFNSNPASATSALETLGKLDVKRKIAVLGDMLELGEYCERGHSEIGKLVPKSADLLFTYGKRSKIISKQAEKSGMKKDNIFHFDDLDDLIKLLKNKIKSDDVILVKGSRAMRMERVVAEFIK